MLAKKIRMGGRAGAGVCKSQQCPNSGKRVPLFYGPLNAKFCRECLMKKRSVGSGQP